MNLEATLHDLASALEAGGTTRRRDGRLRPARQIVAGRCAETLRIETPGQPSIGEVVRAAADTPEGPARRDCAILLVHALAVPGLVPSEAAGEVCSLMESALLRVLLRCGYPFGGSVEEKMHVLERLHARIGELLEPMEPTFPRSIQGLHAG